MTAFSKQFKLKVGELKGTLRFKDNCFFVDHFGTMIPVHIPQLKKLWGTFNNDKIQINQFVRFKKETHDGVVCAILTNVEDLQPNGLVFDESYIESISMFVSTAQFMMHLIDEWNIDKAWANTYFKNLISLIVKELEKIASLPFRLASKYDVDEEKVTEQHFIGSELIERNIRAAYKLSQLSEEEQLRFMALNENLLSRFGLLD